MDAINKPRSKKRPRKIRALTVDEQRKLVEVLNTEKSYFYPQMMICMYAGLRIGECNALTLNDLNLKHGYINVDKTMVPTDKVHPQDRTKTISGMRQVPICKALRPILTELKLKYSDLDPNALMFKSKNGKPISNSSACGSQLHTILNKYDIIDTDVPGDITFHSLRHTFATRCIESGMPSRVLQTIMGHSKVNITLDVYSDVFERFERDNIKKVDDYMSSLGLKIRIK